MKQIFTMLCLIALSVLYLFEVDYTALTIRNWIAFAIILLTVIYVTAMVVLSYEHHKQSRLERKRQNRIPNKDSLDDTQIIPEMPQTEKAQD